MEKQSIRQQISANRLKNVSTHAQKSEIITKKLLSEPSFLAHNSYFIYIGTDAEVQTTHLIAALMALGKSVFCPRTEQEIVAVEIQDKTEYIYGSFGILEPEGTPFCGAIDVAVVPAVAFDTRCNRLGHGKGYYDKYLQNFAGIKLGLAFSYQIVDNINISSYDVPMDAVLTEEGCYARN